MAIMDFNCIATDSGTYSTNHLAGLYKTFYQSLDLGAFYSIIKNLPEDCCVVTGHYYTSKTFYTVRHMADGRYCLTYGESATYTTSDDFWGVHKCSDFPILSQEFPLYAAPKQIYVFRDFAHAAAYATSKSVDTCYLANFDGEKVLFDVVSWETGEVKETISSTNSIFYRSTSHTTSRTKYYPKTVEFFNYHRIYPTPPPAEISYPMCIELMGFIIGQKLRNLLVPVTHYLYNGVKLPAPPVWDKATYPYAYIINLPGVQIFLVISIPFVYGTFTASDDDGVNVTLTGLYSFAPVNTTGRAFGYVLYGDSWFPLIEETWGGGSQGVYYGFWEGDFLAAVWTDTTIDNVDTGTVYLERSAPVPVREEHVHKYTAIVTPPTCTAKGYTTNICSCGQSFISDEVAALGHKYNSTVTAPTCAEEGYTTYTCSCGDSYKDNYTEKPWHTVSNSKCSVCGCTIQKVEISTVTKQSGAAVHATTGELNYQWSNNWIADISIPEGAKQVRFQAVQSKQGYGSAFLDANGNFISGHTTTEYYPTVFLDIPANAKIFRWGQNYDCQQAVEFAIATNGNSA